MRRWLYSTDARDIGILYLLISAFSGMLGTTLSMFIRLQLMDVNQSSVLNMPNQLYNVVITVHALLMIFYLIMPSLFGGFGKKILDGVNKKFYTIIKKDQDQSFNLGYYLAGLIEGDGSITVSKYTTVNLQRTKYYPKITIVFNKDDLKLAEYLKNLLNCGYILKKSGYLIWQIQDLKETIKIFTLINGKMRTPKIEALHRAIIYLKNFNYLDKDFPLLDLDNSPINSNAWLSGFTDADGNFSINVYKRKNNNYRVTPYFKLKQNSNQINNSISYFNIFSIISSYFNVNLYSRTKNTNFGFSQSFIIMVYSKESLLLLTNYFNKFPLLSSKYLNYLDFYKVIELKRNNTLTKDYIEKILEIKKNSFNFNHLNNSPYFIN